MIKESPELEGLPTTSEITGEQNDKNDTTEQAKAAANLSAGQIFYRYVFKNKNAWFVSLVDTFVYLIRFGILTWIPIYLLQVKGFSKAEMAIAFLFFEWAAIPSTLFAGYIFMSYIVGASGGTSLYGIIVDKVGWDGGFYLLFAGAILCIIFALLAHRGAKQLKAEMEAAKQAN